MPEIKSAYSDTTVTVDGKHFIECTFTRCVVAYSGGPLPRFERCRFEAVTFKAVDAAANTLAFLKAMAAPNSGLQQVIRDTFKGLNFN